MRARRAALFLLLALATEAFAQPVARTFLELSRRPLPQPAEVATRSGVKVKGTLVEVREDSLVLQIGEQREVIRAEQVLTVFVPGLSDQAIRDTVVVGAAVGAIGGVAGSYCKDRPPVGQPLLAATGFGLLTLLGVGFSDTNEPHEIYRAPDAEAAGIQEELIVHAARRDHVRVLDHEGRWIKGRLVEITEESVILQGAWRRRVVPRSKIQEVHGRVDRPWDKPLIGAATGALIGVLTSRCEAGDEIERAPRGSMALWGAGILGVTGLVLDLARTDRTAQDRTRRGCGQATSVSPLVGRQGEMGALVVIRF